jgi:hypothetical protein
MSKITENVLIVIGESGKSYEFMIYSLDTEFKSVSGIYIFAKRYKKLKNELYRYKLIYCGKAKELSNRFYNHHKKDPITEHKPNCICIMKVRTAEERTFIEKDILGNHNFPCNQVLNS